MSPSDPLPRAAFLDVIFQRYGWSFDDYLDTPEDVMEELTAWIAGEASANQLRKESGVKPGEEDVTVQASNAGLQLPPGYTPGGQRPGDV